MLSFVLLSCLAVSTWAASKDLSLPPYVQQCKKSNFDTCVVANAQAVMKGIWNGDPKYRIPKVDPYKIIKLEIADNGNKNIALNLTFTDLFITGLKNTRMVGSKTDFDKQYLEWDFEMDRLEYKGKQKTSGKFLLLPIAGEGPVTFELIKLKTKLIMGWDIETRKGKQWMKFKPGDFKPELGGLTVSMKGLFNGDKALEENMNNVLNENWRELNESIGPSFSKAMAAIVYQVVDGIAKVVPYENMVG